MKIRSILENLDRKCPFTRAEPWDNGGLLLGDLDQETEGVVVSVDLTLEAIQLATDRHFHLIINHHPLLFPKKGGLASITQGDLVYEALKRGIAVAAYHTPFDQSALEVVDEVSSGLGCIPRGRFLNSSSLESPLGIVRGVGYGFWGDFEFPLEWETFAQRVKHCFEVPGFYVTGWSAEKKIQRMGFVAGQGEGFLTSAREQGCEVYITGEVGYHFALASAAKGLGVVELGHPQSERFFVSTLLKWMREWNIAGSGIFSCSRSFYSG